MFIEFSSSCNDHKLFCELASTCLLVTSAFFDASCDDRNSAFTTKDIANMKQLGVPGVSKKYTKLIKRNLKLITLINNNCFHQGPKGRQTLRELKKNSNLPCQIPLPRVKNCGQISRKGATQCI